MNIVVQIAIGLAGLGFMVFIHELGHFLAARAVGIEVEVFAIGWGPRLIGFKRGNTDYRLAWFPIGGYCKMKGEQDMTAALAKKAEYIDASEGSFYAAKPWKRIVVAAAGPVINLLFAVIVLSFIWGLGFSYQSSGNTILLRADYNDLIPATSDKVADPAIAAGLKSGDRIVAINGKKTESFFDIQSAIIGSAKETITLSVERSNSSSTEKLFFRLTPEMGVDGNGYIGIIDRRSPEIAKVKDPVDTLKPGDTILEVNGIKVGNAYDIVRVAKTSTSKSDVVVKRNNELVHLSVNLPYDKDIGGIPGLSFAFRTFVVNPTDPFNAFRLGVEETVNTVQQAIHAIALIFRGLDPSKAVSGPGRIVFYVGEAAVTGFESSFGDGMRQLFKILALISIALFFGNLLPIPALDGGQIILYLYEAIRRKPPRLSFITRYQIVGVVMVLALLGLALFGDLTHKYPTN